MREHRRGALVLDESPSPSFQLVIVAVAACVAVAAFVVTLTSGILLHPGWLAFQHANMVVGPALAGICWWRSRPASRLGPLLVALGFVSAFVMFQAASNPFLHSLGVAADGPGFVMTLYILLAFPTGRLRGWADRAIVSLIGLTVLCTFGPALFLAPRLAAGGPISGCRDLCPENGWLIADRSGLASTLVRIQWYAAIALTLATAGVLAARYIRGNPAQRRALATGVSVGVVFCLAFATFHIARLFEPHHPELARVCAWTLAGARAALPWGMLVALATAEIYGGHLLSRLVASVLQRPATHELEQTLASALHDPELRLAFWDPLRAVYVDVAGIELTAPEPTSGRVLTEVRRDGAPAVAILHDEQLREGPELVQAAGAAALLAYENARLEDDLGALIADLRRSRARLASASVTERRRLERDLHDGAQQQFVVFRMQLAELAEQTTDEAARCRLGELDSDLARAHESLRELALGIYPALLADAGIGPALDAVGDRTSVPLTLSVNVGRYPIAIESAVYYCALEAIQNATKHAGPDAAPVIVVDEVGGMLLLTVRDRGRGFERSTATPGEGLRNMQDRIGAVGGELVVESVPGRGTVVRASIPTDGGLPAITSDG